MAQLNTKEKCTLRDLIKEEIKSLDKAEDGYGQYRYDEYEYCTFLLKLGRKLKLDTQQKVKAKKLYTRIKWVIYLLWTQFKLNCATVLCEYFIKIKEDKNVLFISLATISINRLWNIFSVNLLNNLQGGKHDKKRKAK